MYSFFFTYSYVQYTYIYTEWSIYYFWEEKKSLNSKAFLHLNILLPASTHNLYTKHVKVGGKINEQEEKKKLFKYRMRKKLVIKSLLILPSFIIIVVVRWTHRRRERFIMEWCFIRGLLYIWSVHPYNVGILDE